MHEQMHVVGLAVEFDSIDIEFNAQPMVIAERSAFRR
jgi:hypothetical protein